MFLKTTLQTCLRKKLLLLFLIFLALNKSFAQNGVAINTTGAVADGSSILDLSNSINKGLLLPQVTSTGSVTTPAKGLVVYQVNSPAGIYCNTGTSASPVWILLSSSTGTVTGVTASGPLSSSGGPIPNISLTGIVPIANGGTNGIAVPVAGGLAYGNSAGTAYAFTAAGTSTTVLHGNGTGTPTFGALVLTTDVTGILPIANGGTNIGTIGSAGSVIYSNGTQHVSTAVGTNGQVLTSSGSGVPGWSTPANGTLTSFSSGNLSPLFTTSVSNPTTTPALSFTAQSVNAGFVYGNHTSATAIPTFGQVVLTNDVTGILPIANGGTNIPTIGSAGSVIYSNGTQHASTAVGTSGQVLTSNGTGVPVWTSATTFTLGQSSATIYGTGTLSVSSSTTSFTTIPGLTSTVAVPSNSVVLIATDGGMQTNSASTTGYSSIDVAVFIDGIILANGAYQRIIAANTSGVTGVFAYWSESFATILPAGSHIVTVRTLYAAGSSSSVGGNNSTVIQPELTVSVIKL